MTCEEFRKWLNIEMRKIFEASCFKRKEEK